MTRALAQYWTLLRRAAAGHRIQATWSTRPPHGRTGPPFPWAAVAAHDLDALARGAALRVLDRWTEARRWFAHLAPA